MKPRWNALRAAGFAAGLLGASAACGTDGSVAESLVEPASQQPSEVHLAVAPENGLVMEAKIIGALQVNDKGCFVLSGTPLRVPHGSRILADDRVEMKGIGTFTIGDEVTTAGGWVTAKAREDLPKSLRQCFSGEAPFEWVDLG